MASSPPLDRRRTRRQLPAAALSRVGASTAQAALARIIAIIAAGPPPSLPLLLRPDAAARGNTSSLDPEEQLGAAPPAQQPPGLCIDLSLRLGPSTEIGGGSAEGEDVPAPRSVVQDVSTAVGCDGGPCAAGMTSSETVPGAAVVGQSLSPAVSAAGGCAASTVAKSSEAECDSKGENRSTSDVREKAFEEREESKGSGGGEAGTTTTTTILSSSNSTTRGKGRSLRSEGCLDLLLEAVRQVSGGAFDEEEDESEAKKLEPAAAEEEEKAPASGRTRRSAGGSAREKRRREAADCWIPFDLYEADTAPIVRSKRGRNQAMPSKYRDCVLDPWRKPPALTRPGRAERP